MLIHWGKSDTEGEWGPILGGGARREKKDRILILRGKKKNSRGFLGLDGVAKKARGRSPNLKKEVVTKQKLK